MKESYVLTKAVVTDDAKTAGPILGNAGAGLLDAAVTTGVAATALEHNTITAESSFTSWSTNVNVATNFAIRPGGSGVCYGSFRAPKQYYI